MVYDFVHDKNTDSKHKKDMTAFNAIFLFTTLKNYLIIFLVSILIFISSYESWFNLGLFSVGEMVFIVLFLILIHPFSYLIYNFGKYPNRKLTYFLRFILFLVSGFATALFLFNLVTNDLIDNNWGNILVVWLVVFAVMVTLGSIFKINSLGGITVTSKTPDYSPSSDKQKLADNTNDSYLRHDLISKLFSKKDLTYMISYFYFYLGISLIILLNLSFNTNGEYLLQSVFQLFFFLFIFSIFISVLSSVFKTLYERNTETSLIRDLIVARLIIYVSLSIIIGIALMFVNSTIEGYYYSNEYNSFVNFISISTQLFAIWIIPLLVYSSFYYRKRSKNRSEETYDTLMGSSLARNLSRYYLLTRLSEIKTILNSTDPLDFDMKFRRTIENNISRLVESCNSNGISIKSRIGLKKYVLHIATPLRESLREAIGQNFTEIYLSDEIPSDERVINYDEVWRKINKAFLQWESGSSKE